MNIRQIEYRQSGLKVPCIASGCMRISELTEKQIAEHISTCMESGINFFDHADIYGRGVCEEKFGATLKNSAFKREEIIIQSKCSIIPGKMYDMSKAHILESVDGILKRLKTDYLDILLMHRPDALAEPEEVAEAFNILFSSGKVRHFGISNHKPSQIELLKKFVRQPLEVNQMQLSIPFSNMIANGIEVNTMLPDSADRGNSVLDYCRLNDITIQAWSPMQNGLKTGTFIGDCEKYPELNTVLDRLSEKYNSTPAGISIAWILRHPADIQPVIGTVNPGRIKEIAEASRIVLTKEEWYELFIKAGHNLP